MAQAVIQAAPAVLSAIDAGYQFASKYAPKIRGMANNIFSKRKIQSAMHYVKNLASPKGLKKLFTMNLGHDTKEASKYISSGKFVKGLGSVSHDLNNVVSATKPLIGDSAHQSISNTLDKAQGQLTHFHDVAHQYNESGKELATQWNNRANAAVAAEQSSG